MKNELFENNTKTKMYIYNQNSDEFEGVLNDTTNNDLYGNNQIEAINCTETAKSKTVNEIKNLYTLSSCENDDIQNQVKSTPANNRYSSIDDINTYIKNFELYFEGPTANYFITFLKTYYFKAFIIKIAISLVGIKFFYRQKTYYFTF